MKNDAEFADLSKNVLKTQDRTSLMFCMNDHSVT